MADSSAVAFGAAVLGAGVGGLASSIGSIWVARRELSRAARLRMYREHLPPILLARRSGKIVAVPTSEDAMDFLARSKLEAVLEELGREAVLAGRRDVALVADVASSYREVTNAKVAHRHGPEEAALSASLSALEDHLAKRVR